MSADRDVNADTSDDNKLVRHRSYWPLHWMFAGCLLLTNIFLFVFAQVRPKVEFHTLLQHAGATKDVLTMKEVQHVCVSVSELMIPDVI